MSSNCEKKLISNLYGEISHILLNKLSVPKAVIDDLIDGEKLEERDFLDAKKAIEDILDLIKEFSFLENSEIIESERLLFDKLLCEARKVFK